MEQHVCLCVCSCLVLRLTQARAQEALTVQLWDDGYDRHTSYLLAYCFLGGMMAMAYHLIGRMMAHRQNIMCACVRVFRLNQTRGQEALAVQFWCLRCRSYPWGHSLDSVLQSEPSPLSPGGQQPHNGVLFLGAGAAGPFISSASSTCLHQVVLSPFLCVSL